MSSGPNRQTVSSASAYINTSPSRSTPEKRISMGPLLRLDSTGEDTFHIYKTERNSPKTFPEDRFSSCVENVSAYWSKLKQSQPCNTGTSLSANKSSLKDIMADILRPNSAVTSQRSPKSDINTCTFRSMRACDKSAGITVCPQISTPGRFDCLKSQGPASGLSPTKGIFEMFKFGPISNTRLTPSHGQASQWRSKRCSPCNTNFHYNPQQRNSTNPHQCGSTLGSKIDSNLKPYNARLLQKSKQMQDEESVIVRRKFAEKSAERKVDQENVKQCDSGMCPNALPEKPEHPSPESSPVFNKRTKSEPDLTADSNASKCDLSVHVDVDPICNKSSIEPDWFEFPSEDPGTRISSPVQCSRLSPILPIPLSKSETIDKLNKDHRERSCSSSEDASSKSPPLHSWFSMEEDSENQWIEKSQNRTGNEETSADKTQENLSNNKKGNDSKLMKTINMRQINLKDDQTSKKCDSSSSNEPQKDLSVQLYLRNCHGGKKARPSARKRRRQKAKQEEAEKKPSSPNSGKSQHPLSNSFSFLVGSPSHSFVMSLDELEDSIEWSDSDSDEDDDIDVDHADGFLASCLDDTECLDLFSTPLGFGVFCSITPTSTSQTPSSCSALDAINLTWQLNISVEEDKKEKTAVTSQKQVRFAEDNNLVTVHPMITWSYAYQAARKGPWEEIARDRGRFLRRITDSEKLLLPVLQSAHRFKVFQERFS